jgi:phage terminase large subunit
VKERRRHEFPPKLRFLFQPHRYKVARGGRGSAKSWSFARAQLILGANRPLRILCTREVQKSVKDSVHRLLSDQIVNLGLAGFYQIQDTTIKGKNGTQFIFSGLSDQTSESIKSYAGIDIVWVEEAKNVSERSWKILLPTIRKEGSEIWVTYNPELETDTTHVRFALNPPDDCISVVMNYTDNPWFNPDPLKPSVLEMERRSSLKLDPQGYPNTWEGKTKPAVTGAIYYEEMSKAESAGQICRAPYDPLLKVHVIFDLGWNDAMAISLVQRLRSEIRIIEYHEDSHKTLDHYSAWLKEKRYNWGTVYLPHDGAHSDFKTGKSSVQIMQALGWSVALTPSISIEAGIKLVRLRFGQMFFNKGGTVRLVECLKRYRRQINKQTNEAGQPLHDEFSHGADNLRYVAINADSMTNDEWEDDEDDSSEGRSQHGGY